MRLAVSNIAWPSGADELAAPLLAEHGAEGVEIAPTKVWPRPLEASPHELRAYRAAWERRGIRVAAMQALLFGHPEMVLFGDEPARRQTLDYLKGMTDLAATLGAEALVFGSPKNRLVGDRPRAEADALAAAFFRELGDHAAGRGVAVCMEANPTAYGCDFVTTTPEALELVRRVDSEGFRLHVDTGGMTLSGEDPSGVLDRSENSWNHFHISEPHLTPIGTGGADHPAFASGLRRTAYERWVSIEMKEAAPEGSWLDALRDSLAYSRRTYLDAPAQDREPK